MVPGPSTVTRRSPRWAGSFEVTAAARARPGCPRTTPRIRAQHGVALEVAGDGDDRVVGRVEGAIVPVELVARHRFQVALPADDRVMVGMHLKRRGLQRLTEQETRVVLVALALGDNHRALQLGFLGVEHRVDHPVGLDAQRQIDAIGRQRLEVGREVDPRHPVEDTALARHRLVELALRIRRRALEEHVLGPMRDAGGAGPLIAAAHPVPHPETGHRRVVHLAQQHGQPVVQNHPADGVQITHTNLLLLTCVPRAA